MDDRWCNEFDIDSGDMIEEGQVAREIRSKFKRLMGQILALDNSNVVEIQWAGAACENPNLQIANMGTSDSLSVFFEYHKEVRHNIISLFRSLDNVAE